MTDVRVLARMVALWAMLAFCYCSWTLVSNRRIYEAGMVNGTIKFVPQCTGFVKQLFGVTNGHGNFVPTFAQFELIQAQINACNNRYGGLK